MEIMQNFDEKKNKRAAANVNERRRMQNINSGFEALRSMIDVQDSAKLSKSAILRHTVEMLRNLMSENQQLREQNTFMRNLYCSQTRSTNPLIPHVSPSKLVKRELQKDTQTPSKKVKVVIAKTAEVNSNALNASDYNSSSFHHASRKSPKKISPSYAIDKLLASPKRLTRSSVIQTNHAYNIPNYPIMESPNRRSLRLMEKDALLTPPPSNECVSISISGSEEQKSIFSSPTTRSKLTIEQRMIAGLFTPESIKGIPVRSAKRSLDAIIDAIDQIERS